MLKIVMPRVVAALRYTGAAEVSLAAARDCELAAEDPNTPEGMKGRLRADADALRRRGLRLHSRGENKMRAIREKWPI